MTKDLYAEYTVRPGHEEAVAELMRELTPKVQAEQGNTLFLPYTLAARPRMYFVLEGYLDDEAFQAHITSEHSRRFNEEIGKHIEQETTALTLLAPFA